MKVRDHQQDGKRYWSIYAILIGLFLVLNWPLEAQTGKMSQGAKERKIGEGKDEKTNGRIRQSVLSIPTIIYHANAEC